MSTYDDHGAAEAALHARIAELEMANAVLAMHRDDRNKRIAELEDKLARDRVHLEAAMEENAELEAQRDKLRAALADALSGWRYIRAIHGDLEGVGWNRVEMAAAKALAETEGFGESLTRVCSERSAVLRRLADGDKGEP